MARLRLRQVRSVIGANRRQRETLRALGLGRVGSTCERPDVPALRGMIAAVGHLVEVVDARTGGTDSEAAG